MKTAYIAKQRQISFVKSHFSRQLEEKLGLIEVQAPILSRVGDGTQDNLSGCEKAVQVKVKTLPDAQFEVVHSLAKWKRQTLGQHDFSAGEGLYTHMKALRPDEDRLSPMTPFPWSLWPLTTLEVFTCLSKVAYPDRFGVIKIHWLHSSGTNYSCLGKNLKQTLLEYSKAVVGGMEKRNRTEESLDKGLQIPALASVVPREGFQVEEIWLCNYNSF